MLFLRRFADTLSFSEEELENSMVAIEGFVLEHWKDLLLLQDKKNYQQVNDQYIKRMIKITERNRNRLVRKAKDSEALMSLLIQARSQELTDTEKCSLQEQLIEMLKVIPTFDIISLPQRYLTLPILMQILPKNLIAETLTP